MQVRSRTCGSLAVLWVWGCWVPVFEEEEEELAVQVRPGCRGPGGGAGG